MVTSSLSERHGAGPGRSKVCWIMGDPFITSSTMVKMVVRTVAFSSICSALLVGVVYTLKRTTVLFPCQQLAQCVIISTNICPTLPPSADTESPRQYDWPESSHCPPDLQSYVPASAYSGTPVLTGAT